MAGVRRRLSGSLVTWMFTPTAWPKRVFGGEKLKLLAPFYICYFPRMHLLHDALSGN